MSPFFKDLEGLYGEVPPVPCTGCGHCCVTPTVTLVEFVHLMKHVTSTFEQDEVARLLTQKMRPHERFEGNFQCKFLSPLNKCTVHPGRPLACRLHGLPVLDELDIPGLVTYTEMDTSKCPRVPMETLQEWIDRIAGLNARIYPMEAPFFLSGLNLECWLAVCFDDLIDGGIFIAIKKFLRENIDLEFLRPLYRDTTRLKEKLDKIEILYQLQGVAERATIVKLLNSLVQDYPRTGTFFTAEAKRLLELLSESPPVPAPAAGSR